MIAKTAILSSNTAIKKFISSTAPSLIIAILSYGSTAGKAPDHGCSRSPSNGTKFSFPRDQQLVHKLQGNLACLSTLQLSTELCNNVCTVYSKSARVSKPLRPKRQDFTLGVIQINKQSRAAARSCLPSENAKPQSSAKTRISAFITQPRPPSQGPWSRHDQPETFIHGLRFLPVHTSAALVLQ